jgi:hypothetical protein
VVRRISHTYGHAKFKQCFNPRCPCKLYRAKRDRLLIPWLSDYQLLRYHKDTGAIEIQRGVQGNDQNQERVDTWTCALFPFILSGAELWLLGKINLYCEKDEALPREAQKLVTRVLENVVAVRAEFVIRGMRLSWISWKVC